MDMPKLCDYLIQVAAERSNVIIREDYAWRILSLYVEYIKRVLFLYPSSYINTTMFNRVGAVILLVSDMKKSKEFYNNVMGMEIKLQTDDWVEFSKQGTVIALHPAKKKKQNKSIKNKSMLIGFNVSDLEAVCSDLESKKVKFYKKLTQEQFGKHAIIEDPDEHLISLVEMAPKEEFVQSPYYHGFAPI